MSALFRKKSRSNDGETFLVIDVENGSAAAGLARVAAGEEPKLFGEKRVRVPLMPSRDSATLAHALDAALEEALVHATETAAYLRAQPETASIGALGGAAVFLGAPWAALSRSEDRLRWELEPEFLGALERRIETRVAAHLIGFHPSARAAAHAAQRLGQDAALLCILSGEVFELAYVEQGRIVSRATVPMGEHTLVRTLMSHAGLSAAEAHSALRLAHTMPAAAHPHASALDAAAKEYAAAFCDAARDIAPQAGNVLIIAPHDARWFAQALSAHADASFFTPGAAVRALSARNMDAHVLVHPSTVDVPLMLEALFVHTMQTAR